MSEPFSLPSTLFGKIRTLFQPIVIDDITKWRDSFAAKACVLMTIVMPIGMLATFPFFFEQSLLVLIVLDLAIYAWLLLAIGINRFPLTPSGPTVMISLLILSVSFHLALGPEGARPAWVAVSIALAAALYGMRGVWSISVLYLAIFGMFYLLIPPTFPSWHRALAKPWTSSFMTCANIVLISFVIGSAIAVVLRGMEQLIRKGTNFIAKPFTLQTLGDGLHKVLQNE